MHLLLSDGNNFFSTVFKHINQCSAFINIVDAVGTHNSIIIAHTHHYIGVVNGKPFSVNCLKSREKYWFESENFTELQKYRLIRSLGQCGISNAVNTVKNHTSGSFQKQILLFPEGKINHVIDNRTFIFEHLENIAAP